MIQAAAEPVEAKAVLAFQATFAFDKLRLRLDIKKAGRGL